MAEGNPDGTFRREWWPYSYRRRLFQNDGTVLAPIVSYHRSRPFFDDPAFIMPPRRRYSPLRRVGFWGHITLLWGPD